MQTKKIAIHASKNIPWQTRYASAAAAGLQRHGIKTEITDSRKRKTDVAVIMGPNLWINIESDMKDYIIFNRKFLGFEERDAHDNVAISWNGFNGMGIFCVDEKNMSKKRLEKYLDPRQIEHWSLNHDKYLLCEQANTGRSERYKDINQYYRKVRKMVRPDILKTRNKIILENVGPIEFLRGLREDLSDVKAIFSLNSTVSVEAIVLGKGVITDDITNPCYGVSSSYIGGKIDPFDRTPFLTYLAHCQWHINEISSGKFFENMTFGPHGPRLHEIGNYSVRL